MLLIFGYFTDRCRRNLSDLVEAPPNKSLDARGGSVNSLPIVDLIRAAASTQSFGCFH